MFSYLNSCYPPSFLLHESFRDVHKSKKIKSFTFIGIKRRLIFLKTVYNNKKTFENVNQKGGRCISQLKEYGSGMTHNLKNRNSYINNFIM